VLPPGMPGAAWPRRATGVAESCAEAEAVHVSAQTAAVIIVMRIVTLSVLSLLLACPQGLSRACANNPGSAQWCVCLRTIQTVRVSLQPDFGPAASILG
jgi:hypothetical protein